MIKLFGQFSHKVDSKGRVSLPAKFRKALEAAYTKGEVDSKELVVTLDPTNTCLYVFTANDFEDWVDQRFESAGGFNVRNKDHVKARRALTQRAESLFVDSAGRINLPEKMLHDANIKDTAELVGNFGYFEIWNAQCLEKDQKDVDLESLLFD